MAEPVRHRQTKEAATDMFDLQPPRHIPTLPRLCENAKAINRDRTSYSFKTVSSAHIASAFNFEIAIKNIVLVALRTFEFSHGLGQNRKNSNRANVFRCSPNNGHSTVLSGRGFIVMRDYQNRPYTHPGFTEVGRA
jgi:hypothetical protein